MERQRSSIALYLLITFSFVETEALHYIVSAPNVFRLNVPETVGVTVTDHNAAVTVEVLIQSHPTKNEIAKKRLTIENGKPQITTLTYPESAIPEIQKSDELIFVYLLVRSPLGVFQPKEILIPVRKYSGYAFLQTDKPLYTPKDNVKIRILNLNEKLLPGIKPLTLEIKNPNSSRVFYEEFKADDKGIIEYAFNFPIFPVQGIWTASIKYGYKMTGTKTVSFEVKEYELPTFSVTIIPPKVILNSDKKIETQIIANYVYGKPVVGLLNIKFGIKTSTGMTFQIGALHLQHLEEGKKWILIDVQKDIKDKKIVWFPEADGSNFLIEAEVIETATGNRESSSDHTTIFSYSPYTISFPRSSTDFKPGVPYQVQVDIKLVNGKEASKTPVRILSAKAKKGGQVTRTLPDLRPSITNEIGRVMFKLGTAIEDDELEITVTTEDQKLSPENQATNKLNVLKFKSPDSRSYVWISAPPDEMLFKVGKTFETQVTVFPAEGEIKLHYLVISRGMLLVQGESQRGKNTVVHPIQFAVTADMSPSARLIVYMIKNNQIIADSMKIEVEKTCKYNNGDDLKLSAETNAGFFRPGQTVDIEITGEQNSYVGLLAVDEAVYLLSKEGLLTRETMFDEMEAHDLGCGPGGGTDTEAVFRKTGFLVLSNAVIKNHNRIAGECDGKSRKKRSILLTKPIKQEDIYNYTDTAAICCKIGRLDGPPGLDCTQRAAKIYEAIGDAENCSQAFLDCCETEDNYQASYMAVARSALANKDSNSGLTDSELIERFEVDVLQNLRHSFPETWIFNTKQIISNDCDKNNKKSCKLVFRTNLPHSITNWRVQAIAVSDKTGLCIADPKAVRVFKSVFIQMKLPYSAIRMEQIQVPVTIFNYGDEELPVSVYMFGVEGICMGAGPGERSESQKVNIPPNSASTVTFPIMPLEVASFPLRVVALAWSESDAVEKTLRVVPEGVPKVKPLTITLDPMGSIRQRKKRSSNSGIEETFNEEHNRQSLVIEMPLPKEHIPGTEKCIVSTIGDFLGQAVTTSVKGLEERFFHLPNGCGEQTMIRLAPLVYSMLYLKRTSRLTADGEKKGYSLMQQGYSHQLNYRKADGSFAVWANHESSTWLTALVAKVFCQATLFINIPKEVTCNALDWTLKKQKNTGAFYADFGVYHKDMTGGIQSEATLTAYVLIALMECSRCDSPNKRIAAALATSYLETHVDFMDKPYSLAVVTYALTLAKSPKASIANEKLKSLAIYNEAAGNRYWDVNPAEFQKNQPWIYVNRPAALAVETTSYALLVQLLFDNIAYSHPIANWLNQQRNEQGAFVSTQDTIMALQALSEYSFQANLPSLNMNCNISSQMSRSKRHLTMNTENSLTLQKFEMPAGGKIYVDVEGKGVATMTLALHYNVETNKKEKCKFELKVKTIESDDVIMPQMPKPEFDSFDFLPVEVVRSITSSNDQKRKFGYQVVDEAEDEHEAVPHESRHIVKLEICVRYLEKQPAGMSILDIGLFTGYKPVHDDLVKLIKDRDLPITQFEPSDTSLVLYLDTVPHNRELCFQLRTAQEISVGKVQPAIVKIYDYYEPDKFCQKFYTPDGGSAMLNPICEENQCRCVEGLCPPCYPFKDLKEEVDTQEQRKKIMHLACDKHNFVWNGSLVLKTDKGDGFTEYDFHVTEVLKEGLQTKEKVIDEIITFTARSESSCACPKMELDKAYIIMGRDGFRYKDVDNVWQYKYTFDQKTSVYEMRFLREISDEKERELQKTFLWLYRRMVNRKIGCSH